MSANFIINSFNLKKKQKYDFNWSQTMPTWSPNDRILGQEYLKFSALSAKFKVPFHFCKKKNYTFKRYNLASVSPLIMYVIFLLLFYIYSLNRNEIWRWACVDKTSKKNCVFHNQSSQTFSNGNRFMVGNILRRRGQYLESLEMKNDYWISILSLTSKYCYNCCTQERCEECGYGNNTK